MPKRANKLNTQQVLEMERKKPGSTRNLSPTQVSGRAKFLLKPMDNSHIRV